MRFPNAPLRLLLAWSLLLSPFASVRAAEPSAVDYLTPRSVAALTVRPAAAAGLEILQHLPIEVADAALKKHLGLPLSALERVTVVAEPPAGVMPQYAVVLNASQPIDFNRLDPELFQHTEASELEGRPLMESREQLAPSLCLLNEKTLAVGPKAFLKRLLKEKSDEEPSKLARAMQAEAGGANHVHGALMLDPLKPLLQLGLAQAMQEAPPETHKYFQAIDLIQGVILAADLTFERDSALTVYANNASDADRLAYLLEQGVAEFRAKAFDENANYQKLSMSEDPVEQATAMYMDRLYYQQVQSLWPRRDGDKGFVIGEVAAGESPNAMAQAAVIGVLVALILPAVQAAREAARRTVSMNNLKQLLLGLYEFEEANGKLPSQAIYSKDGKPLLSWRVAILPYIGEEALFKRFKLDEPWDSVNNLPLLALMPETFFDPSSQLVAVGGKTHYLAVTGPDCAFTGQERGRTFRQIRDGTANTLVFVQVDDNHAVEWTKPVDYDMKSHLENPIGGIGSLHPGVFLAAYADAHVSAIPTDTPSATLRAAMTAAGGESIAAP